ncbi:MAG TPA: hypothetical protein VFN44_02120 [Solirubrobacteraceae bacterium]|nr:hypothetical protein [Solirubrobacteraceae bacterium]
MRRMTGGITALAATLAAFAGAAPAQAGIYTVYACNTAGRQWDNRSWELVSPVGNISADQDCAGDSNIGLNQSPGGRTADGAQASLQFLTPSGTMIADFRLTKRIIFRNPTQDGTHRYHVITALGSTAIEGAGNYANATRDRLNAQGRWYGYPEGNADTGIVTVSKASFPALAGYTGTARSLTLRIGCTERGTPCSSTNAAHIANNMRGAEVDVDDPAGPRDLTVDASGLLRGGQVSGSDPVRVKVTDPSGIRRLQIVDVTGAPVVVGSEDYDADSGGVQTDRGASCNFRFASPCPQLSYGETLRPTSLTAGRRKLMVRAYDAGGNLVERGPYEAEVVTPSDRGALNGGNATEGGSITARFTHGNRGTRRTIGYLSKADVAGQLLNDAGQPITNARVAVLTRDIDDDEAKLRTYVTTDGEGRFAYRATAYASRLYQFAWTSHVNDVRFAANGYVTLLARATSTLNPSPRSVRVGQRLKLYGRLAGKRPRRSVDIVAQGRAGKRGSFRTFADGTIGRDGRFRISYRFRDPASRGRTFQFRIKIERDSGYAYWGGYSRIAKVRVR